MSKPKTKTKTKKHLKPKSHPTPRDGRGVSIRMSDADHAALVKRAALAYRTVPAQVQYELAQLGRAKPEPKPEGPEEA